MTAGAANHYPTLSIADICALPVREVVADNALLVLWWVGSQPREALDVVDAWGFTVKNMNGFVWNKLTKLGKPFFGMGFYTRAGSESAIIATRGKFKVADRGVRAVRSEVVQQHSRKPHSFYNDIERLCPDGRKLELFARNKRSGWDSWGNETDKF